MTILLKLLEFEKHLSIIKIQEMPPISFAFKCIFLDDENNEIQSLKTWKTSTIDTC